MLPQIRLLDIAIAITSGLAFIGSWEFNHFFDSYFVYAPGISFLFIPAGVKLLCVLLGRIPAVVGLLIASVYTGTTLWTDMQMPAIYYFALVSVLCYPISAYIVMRLLGIHRELYNLQYWHIVVLSLAASVLNGVAHNVVYIWQGVTATEEILQKAMAMAIGDFFGCFVVVGLFHGLMSMFRASKLDSP
jgi:glucose-6-phosphate-specific signal transduction histidine kinase